MKGMENHKRKKMAYASAGLIILATVAMFILFIFSSCRIHDMVLKREMEQNELVTSYITEILNSEMEDCIELLNMSRKFLDSSDQKNWEAEAEVLKKVKEGTAFTVYGVMDLEGKSLDDSGKREVVGTEELLETIKDGEEYISDVLTDDEIILAVPLYNKEEITGAVWGSYPIDTIAEKVEKTGDTQRYFQIIDSDGTYISRSKSNNSFAESLPLWEELERYEFQNGETVDMIRDKVNRHETGTFYFQYKGKERYVAYEPLGINNWYVFSVLVGESIDGYVKNIRETSTTLMLGFAFFIMLIFSVFVFAVNWSKKIVEDKNHQLEIKTKLFWVILSKTKDIPFEINMNERQAKIYRAQTTGNEDYELIDDVSPERMILEGRIHESDAGRYRQMYDQAFEQKQECTLILEMNLQGIWSWKKIHLIMVNEDSMIGFLEDYNEQIDQNRKLEEAWRQTEYDELTGLYNRETFVRKVDRLLLENADEHSALFLLDLDHFKEINDTFGHMMGDQVLHEAAENLRNVLRKADLAGRLGGDEFVVFLRNVADTDSLHVCAQKINKVLEKTYERDGQKVHISGSIGIAAAADEMTFPKLYERADKALYEAKRNGRNRYQISQNN